MTKKPNLELRKEWVQRIADHKAIGLSQAKWCEDNSIKLSSIWVLEERIKDQDTEKAKDSWAPVVIEEAKTASSELLLLIKIGSVSIEVNYGFNPTLLE